jgi:hypothetical protein
MHDKSAQWTYSGGDPERSLTKDEMLDDITLYWLTHSVNASSQLYWENNANNFKAVDISLPAAITVLPGELYQIPRAWEEPDLFSREMRAAFKCLRVEGTAPCQAPRMPGTATGVNRCGVAVTLSG